MPDSNEVVSDPRLEKRTRRRFSVTEKKRLPAEAPGDAEQALGYYEASLKTREDLHRRNSDSAEAARDLSVSQDRLSDFHLQRGQPGDAERGLGYVEAAAQTFEGLLE